MCDPVTAGVVASVATIGSAGVSAYGQYKAGQAQKAAANYQAEVDKRNAVVAQENANMERQAGIEEQRRQRLKTAQVIGQQKVAMAANGLDINSGTAADLLKDTAELGELDALMIGYDAERRARNHGVQGSNFMSQATLNQMSASNAFKSGLISAGGTMLGGLGKVSDQWTRYYRKNNF